MSLVFINENSKPSYLALSTDISGSAISGASLIGKTIYITDTQEWYIISGSGGLLSPYKNPQIIGESSGFTFDEVVYVYSPLEGLEDMTGSYVENGYYMEHPSYMKGIFDTYKFNSLFFTGLAWQIRNQNMNIMGGYGNSCEKPYDVERWSDGEVDYQMRVYLAPKNFYNITGSVVNASNEQPLQDITIYCTNNYLFTGTDNFTRNTNSSGSYSFNVPEGTNSTIYIIPDGFIVSCSPSSYVIENISGSGVDISFRVETI